MSNNFKPEVRMLSESTKDVAAWFKRYEINARMGQWIKTEVAADGATTESTATLLECLPAFLEEGVLVAFDSLPFGKRATYEVARDALIDRYALKPRQAYEAFVTSRIQAGSTVDGFVDQLKRSLERAVPGLQPGHVEDLVLFQLLFVMPVDKRDQILLASERVGEKLTLSMVVEKARSVTLVPQAFSAAMNTTGNQEKKGSSDSSNKSSPKKKGKGGRRCYNCQEYGHVSENCPNPKKAKNSGKGAQSSQ